MCRMKPQNDSLALRTFHVVCADIPAVIATSAIILDGLVRTLLEGVMCNNRCILLHTARAPDQVVEILHCVIKPA